MGNCQAIDAATLVIQHPSGKEEKLYWPVNANEVMKSNPNHYVALLITSTLCPTADGHCVGGSNGGDQKSSGGLVRVTRVKVLRPTETLALGQVYRLITAQEVMRGLRAKKEAKMMMKKKKNQSESEGKGGGNAREEVSRSDANQAIKREKHRTSTANSASAKARTWQPSLKSIAEGAG